MEQIYNTISNALIENANLFRDHGVMPVKFVDIYDGQPSEAESFEFPLPAVFVDYEIDWGFGVGSESGTVTIELHALYDDQAPSDNLRKKGKRVKKLIFNQIISEILNNLKCEHCTTFVLKSEKSVLSDFFAYHKFTISTQISRGKVFETGSVDTVDIKRTYTLPT